jgi:phage tail sheath gpL-like
MSANFTFTRNPSVKASVDTSVTGLVTADNTLTLVGRLGATAGTIQAGVPQAINNYGDPVAAALECNTYFGPNSEIGAMVVAAIKGVLYSNLQSKLFPPIQCIALPNTATSANLAATFAINLTLAAPYIAVPFEATDAPAMLALLNHVTAISAADRGDNGQFGSFGFIANDADTSAITPVGIATASPNVVIPWLRDLSATKSNTPAQVASAVAAVCASLGVPYLPVNGVTVGGIAAPSVAGDYHTPGDAGTVALGLAAGLTPLIVTPSGTVQLKRAVTTARDVASAANVAYYDLQDWQVLYYLRKNCYVAASQPRYRQAKATDQVLANLRSEIIQLCKAMEGLQMLEYVDKFMAMITVQRVPSNRNAAVYNVPVNVVPGLMNVGISLTGTTLFDS